jgi:hypothetical protein
LKNLSLNGNKISTIHDTWQPICLQLWFDLVPAMDR